MKKQTALVLSAMVVMSALAMQPASAFSLKFWHKKHKPAVVAPVKKEVKQEVKKVDTAVKTDVKKVEVKKPVAPVKPAVAPAKPAAKAPVKK